MNRQLLPFLLPYAVAWSITGISFASPTFMLGMLVMRLLFHLALLMVLFNDRRFRGYTFFGMAVCLSYVFSTGNSNIVFLYSSYWANVLRLGSISLTLVALMYFVGTLYNIPQHFRQLVPVGWFVGLVCLLNAIDSLFVNHTYLAQVFIGFVAVSLISLLVFLIATYIQGIRPPVWYLIPLLLYLLPHAWFYTIHAFLLAQPSGLPGAVLPESGIQVAFMTEFLALPFLIAIILRQAYRDQLLVQQTAPQTEPKQQQAIALDQLKNRFFANISHEFRTPLTLLLGPLDDLHQRFPNDALYASMHRNAQRLNTLITQLLDLAKLDAGQLKLTQQSGDVAAAFGAWVATFEPMAKSRGIDLTLDQSEAGWQAVYDADKIEKITTILIANALKFTNRGGQVTVEVVYDPISLTLRISDTGVGIPLENLPAVFDRLNQDVPERKSSPVNALYEESGVSLALVRELVDLLEGSIGVASLVGEGSTFTVWIPIKADTHPAPQQESNQSGDTGGPQQPTGRDLTTH